MNRTNESLPRTPTLAAGPGGVHVSPALPPESIGEEGWVPSPVAGHVWPPFR